MTERDEAQRAAAVCESCGTAHAVRLGPDGEIQPIGTGHGPKCTCGNETLQIMSTDAVVMEDAEDTEDAETNDGGETDLDQ
ncbi:hypothetical protein [Natronorubrum daqingense]|uniref:Uncharacterized protein n=1 Tax=Natronorubrum daqingense TaxID=588898 RepID=A0A1N7G8A5_9EURY|nr:hypothetical protein [Natronorubrum daqingense]APX97277.1 hypothetical protein BB347_11975 [Natronorubrum daqingense]SIS08841.1 hypothetical protein SAMN05421809_3797 [Natronorubrum daqingense]